MHPVTMHLDGDNCWPDLKAEGFTEGVLESVAFLERGMDSGAPSVSFRIRLEDGRTIIAQTSLRMYMTIAGAFSAKAEREGFTDFWRPPQ